MTFQDWMNTIASVTGAAAGVAALILAQTPPAGQGPFSCSSKSCTESCFQQTCYQAFAAAGGCDLPHQLDCVQPTATAHSVKTVMSAMGQDCMKCSSSWDLSAMCPPKDNRCSDHSFMTECEQRYVCAGGCNLGWPINTQQVNTCTNNNVLMIKDKMSPLCTQCPKFNPSSMCHSKGSGSFNMGVCQQYANDCDNSVIENMFKNANVDYGYCMASQTECDCAHKLMQTTNNMSNSKYNCIVRDSNPPETLKQHVMNHYQKCQSGMAGHGTMSSQSHGQGSTGMHNTGMHNTGMNTGMHNTGMHNQWTSGSQSHGQSGSHSGSSYSGRYGTNGKPCSQHRKGNKCKKYGCTWNGMMCN